MSKNARPAVIVRKAQPADAAVMLDLITALAHYEKLDPPDAAARERLVRDAFGEKPRFDVYLAEADGTVCGYAFVFETYSTFLALPSLYLEDVFVLPEFRGVGAGMALFRKCVEEADRRGCGRLEWVVLDWNQLARDFYHRLNATHLDNWCPYRLTRNQFAGILNRD